ncbi:MAG: Periplasmic pH-dependent serine endoprotease DegQ [Myxococcota bacterium]|nr:Periplasmic pH-dependent serine endoprotease DegQ [Myxococcota bacterium]
MAPLAAAWIAAWIAAPSAHAQDDAPPSNLRRTPVVIAVEKAAPAIVNINTESGEDEANPFFRGGSGDFDWFNRGGRGGRGASLGSGVIVHPSGVILTNEHVIARANRIRIRLIDDREYDCDVIGADTGLDLAVLRARTNTPLPAAALGKSSGLMPGETVIAIGNPFGLESTVTTGVVSATNRSLKHEGRSYADLIQTDASINPGNSGGALLNIHGELIGINTAIIRDGQGIGFAIPVDRARRVMADLIRFGEVRPHYTGLALDDLSRWDKRQLEFSDTGLLVRKAYEGSPAAEAGVRPGDIVISVDGRKLKSTDEYRDLEAGFTVGQTLRLQVWRTGRTFAANLKVAEFPPTLAVQLAWRRLGIAAAEYGAVEGGPPGARISRVRPGSAAARIGMKAGDVLLKLGGRELRSPDDFLAAMMRLNSQNAAPVLLRRGARVYYLTLPLEEE